jgi:hypothetical protein
MKINLNELLENDQIDLKPLEDLRKEKLGIVRKNLFLSVSIAVSLTIFSFLLFGAPKSVFLAVLIYLLVLFILILILGIILLNKHLSTYVSSFRRDALLLAFNKLNLPLKFSESADITADQFNSNGIFDHASIFKFTDVFQGKILELDTKFGDAVAQRKVATKNGQRTETLFQGLYAKTSLELNKGFSLYLRRDTTYNLTLLQSSPEKGATLVKIPNKAFEKKYVVHSTHPTLAESFFNDETQRKLIKLSKKYNDSVQFSICQGKLHFCLNNGRDNFLIAIRKPVQESLQICFDELNFSIEFVQEFLEMVKEPIAQLQAGNFNK